MRINGGAGDSLFHFLKPCYFLVVIVWLFFCCLFVIQSAEALHKGRSLLLERERERERECVRERE